jgi:hypothetical protein
MLMMRSSDEENNYEAIDEAISAVVMFEFCMAFLILVVGLRVRYTWITMKRNY